MSYVYGQIVSNRAKFAEFRTTPPLGKRDKRVIQMFSARKFAGQKIMRSMPGRFGSVFDSANIGLAICTEAAQMRSSTRIGK
jgi:hypothetical protein